MKTAPRCTLHLGTEMKLETAHQPVWVSTAEGLSARQARVAKRKFWKCPVAGCIRMQAFADEEAAEAKLCPRCKKPSDAPGRLSGNNMCRSCIRINSRLRRMESKRRARQGGMRGAACPSS